MFERKDLVLTQFCIQAAGNVIISSGMKGCLYEASLLFVYNYLLLYSQNTDHKTTSLTTMVRYWHCIKALLKVVDKFCYLGDMLEANGGCGLGSRQRSKILEKVLWIFAHINGK